MQDIDESRKTVIYENKTNTRDELKSEITNRLFWKLRDMSENTVLECNGHYFKIIINDLKDDDSCYKICIKNVKDQK